MRKVTISEALENTAPQPVALICTPRPDGSANLAPVAWWTYLESEPPMMGFSMAKESYTCELVSHLGKVVLSLPSEEISEEVLKCGVISGQVLDKAKEYAIELTGDALKYPIHSKLAFLCTVSQKVIVGDCIFFVCSIDEILLDENQKHIYTLAHTEKLGAI
jgi:flavin reductase (DIM6/NTAB) family NADH-FMN oxidoreductase RutF